MDHGSFEKQKVRPHLRTDLFANISIGLISSQFERSLRRPGIPSAANRPIV